MDRKTMNAIMKLRAAGAFHVRIGNVEVRFAESPPAVASLEGKTQQIVDQALAEFHEALEDQREVEGIEEKRNKRAAMNRLKYAHS